MSIEKFIADNRKDFDDKMPPAKAWEGIEAALTGKKKRASIITPLIKWSMAAAAILVVALVVYFNSGSRTNVQPGVVNTTISTDMPETPEVIAFAKLIVLKQEELKQLSKEQPELYNKFTEDITQLDSSYKALKEQLNVTPNKEVLVEAMIQNLQLQLSVLNQQLNIIKQIKQSKEYSHEKSVQKI